MGLKSGSRDAGLDDSEEDAEQRDDRERTETGTGSETTRTAVDTTTETTSGADTEASSQRPTMDSIPYKLRREKVNQGREQVPFFLREEVMEAEDDLRDALEDLLGEDVYKSDYREAAMVVAQRNPELVAEVLREWGYDLDAT